MTLKNYLILMIIATLACWGAVVFVMSSVNPELTNVLGFVLFYSSLFLAVTGTAAIVGFLIRFWALKQKLAFYSVKAAFRQSFLFALLIIAILLLLSRDLFTWLNVLFIIIILAVLEFLLINYASHRHER